MSPCPLQTAAAHILRKVSDHVIPYGMAPFGLLPSRQAAMICRMRIEFCGWFFTSALYSDNAAAFPPHSNPPEERLDSLMGFWLFTETMCHSEEGCKVNLGVFEVRVVPHWLSLSSLITLFICSRSLTPRISCTLTHISGLWTVTKAFWGLALYFFFCFAPLWSVLKG